MSQKLIEIVEVVKATQRIPQPQRSGVTYFSKWDVWMFQSVFDEVRCEICSNHERIELYYGNALRLWFPHLEILDENTIKAHAHMPRDDNCRCFLVRVLQLTA